MPSVFAISDLHFDKYRFNHSGIWLKLQNMPQADILCLLGDYSDGEPEHLKQFLSLISPKYKHILFVAGNHDYWRNEFRQVNRKFKNVANSFPNVKFLNNSSTTIEDTVFYGGTMWYNGGDQDFSWIDERMIKDSVKIAYNNKKFHNNLLRIKVPKLVVLSHHLPSRACIHPKYTTERYLPYNHFFMDEEAERTINFCQPKMWLFGHTHEFVDTVVNGTRVLANPLGYPDEFPDRSIEENFNFGLFNI